MRSHAAHNAAESSSQESHDKAPRYQVAAPQANCAERVKWQSPINVGSNTALTAHAVLCHLRGAITRVRAPRSLQLSAVSLPKQASCSAIASLCAVIGCVRVELSPRCCP
jgi:hypothetical protein